MRSASFRTSGLGLIMKMGLEGAPGYPPLLLPFRPPPTPTPPQAAGAKNRVARMQPGGPRERDVWAGATWVSLSGFVAWSSPPVLEFGEVERGQREDILGREWTTHRFLGGHP